MKKNLLSTAILCALVCALMLASDVLRAEPLAYLKCRETGPGLWGCVPGSHDCYVELLFNEKGEWIGERCWESQP